MQEPESTKCGPHGELDMANGVDRGSVRYAINGYKSKHKRWEGVDDQFKADCVRALKVALRLSLERGDPRAIRGCVETAKSIEGQNQARSLGPSPRCHVARPRCNIPP